MRRVDCDADAAIVQMTSEYERKRLQNIEENKAKLLELGLPALLESTMGLPGQKKRKRESEGGEPKAKRARGEPPQRVSLRGRGLAPDGKTVVEKKAVERWADVQAQEAKRCVWTLLQPCLLCLPPCPRLLHRCSPERQSGPLAMVSVNVSAEQGAAFVQQLQSLGRSGGGGGGGAGDSKRNARERKSEASSSSVVAEWTPAAMQSLKGACSCLCRIPVSSVASYRWSPAMQSLEQLVNGAVREPFVKVVKDRIYSMAWHPASTGASSLRTSTAAACS